MAVFAASAQNFGGAPHVFGCSASLSLPKVKRGGKLNPVIVSGIFVGYSPYTKGWRVAVGNNVHESPSVVSPGAPGLISVTV